METKPTLIDEYLDFQKHHRGLADGTIGVLRHQLKPFLDHLGDLAHPARLKDVGPANVRRFVTATAEGRGRSGKRAICFAVRGFLRYASMRGYVAPELIEAVPKIPTYTLARLPRAWPWHEVQDLLSVVDRTTIKGKRDYAFIMLLASYGLRIGEAVSIQLEDIDWRHERLIFPNRKAGGPLVLPLTPEVGEALLDYLREGRPRGAHRQVFLQLNRPHLPLQPGGGPRAILKNYMEQAGIRGPAAVPHALRHSLASRLLQQGQPFNVIADILGHTSIRTTSIYAKVDIDHLREVALDLPEMQP